MRIEGGELRGRTLFTPHGNNTRPTDGRTREMLFNSLGAFTEGARVLDLYAGSGAVGIEALSRGAEFVVFVEQEHSAVSAIRRNLKTFGLENRAQVWVGNARSALGKLEENARRFDFVFADPPFTVPNEAQEITKRLDSHPRLLNNVCVQNEEDADFASPSLIVVQHSHRVALPETQNLQLKRAKRAGESLLSFFVAISFGEEFSGEQEK